MTSGSAGAAGAAAASAATGRLLGLRRDDVDDHHVGVADRLPLRALGVQVAHADALVQHQLADVDGDVLRDVARQALDLDLAVDEVDDAALLLDALRLALEHDGTVTVSILSIATW